MILANIDMGLYKFRRELLEELVKENEVYFCVPDGEFVESIKEIGCKFVPCTLMNRHGTNPIQELKLISFYKKVLREIKPDIVFTYTIKCNAYGGMACASLGVPYVGNVTGLGTAIENGGLMQTIRLTLYKMGLRKAQKVFLS
jgi:galacturonosyltransferase